MKIKICKNFSKTNKLQQKLTKAFPEDTILIKKCIDQCSKCKNNPIAKIKEKKFKASRISKLIKAIKDKYR